MKQAYQESPLVRTGTIVAPLEGPARLGARRRLQAALEEEVESYLRRARYQRRGVAQGYRSGYLPERSIILGSAAVSLTVPRVSDKPSGKKVQTRLIRPYQKRSQAGDRGRQRMVDWRRAGFDVGLRHVEAVTAFPERRKPEFKGQEGDPRR